MTRGKVFKTTTGAARKSARRIVWLHGWGQTHASLLPLATLFKNDFSNTLYDLPGFGRSEMLKEGAGTADYADVLIGELEGGGPVILAGHSFGCRVAIRAAAKRPDLVSALVLIAGAGLQKKRSPLFKIKSLALKLLGRLAKFSDAAFKTRFHKKYQMRFGSRDYRDAGALRATFVATVTEDLSAEAAKVKCPVLLVYGADDTETPPEFGHRFAGMFPDASLKIIEGFGHLNILTAGQHRCQHLINGFLRGLEGA